MAAFTDLADYAAARREQQKTPVGFRWAGVDYPATPTLPAFALLDLTAGARESYVEALRQFLQDVLTVESWAAFEQVIRAEKLDADTLDHVVGHLIEQYTGRPTKEPSSSRRSRSKPGAPSKSGSTSKAARTR